MELYNLSCEMKLDSLSCETLQDLLTSQDAAMLVNELACIPHGREYRLLSGHTFVEKLACKLTTTTCKLTTTNDVKYQLDRLFDDIQPGSEFVNTELVMILLFAMKMVDLPLLQDVVGVLDKSQAQELSRLRRFAINL